MKSETCCADICIALCKHVDILAHEQNERTLVRGRIEERVDLKLAQHIAQLLIE